MEDYLFNFINGAKNTVAAAGHSLGNFVSGIENGFSNFTNQTRQVAAQKEQQLQQNLQSFWRTPQMTQQVFKSPIAPFPQPAPAPIAAPKAPSIDFSAVEKGFGDWWNKQYNQPLLSVPGAPQLQFGPSAHNVADFGLGLARSLPRALGEAKLTIDGTQDEFVPTTPAEKALFGSEPIYNFQRNSSGIKNTLAGWGVNPTAAGVGAPVLAGASWFADASPITGGLEEQLGKKMVEVGAERAAKKLSLEELKNVGNAAFKLLDKESQANFTMNWPKALSDMGFTKPMMDKLTTERAYAIVKNGLSPSEVFGGVTQKVGQMTDDAMQAYKDWVNTRSAANIKSAIQSEKFKAFDQGGLDSIFKFQQGGELDSGMQEVKKYFDSKYNQLQQEGVNFHYKSDYLPQLWNNTDQEIEQVMGKSLGMRPSFTLQSVIKDYQEGIAGGLQPKFNSIKDLIGWYEGKTQKLLADKHFFDYLKSKNLIVAEDVAPRGWVTITPDKFPKITTKVGNEKFTGNFKADPELARVINNYLSEPEGALASFAHIVSRIKNMGLAGGVPSEKVALNYHSSVNIYMRDILANRNPITPMFRDLKWMFNVDAADKYVKANMKDADFFVSHGLTLSSEDWKKFIPDNETTNFQKFEKAWEKKMGSSTFEKYLPAIKLSYAKSQYEHLAQYMDSAQAARKATEITNNIFGGINLDELGRSKETQNLLRSTLLAPDWAETQLRIGKGIAKGLTTEFNNPEYQAYRTIATNMVFKYIAENIINRLVAGHWMFQNEGNNKFKVDTNTYDANGNKRYINTWGTAQDFARLPLEAGIQAAGGDPVGAVVNPVSNRLSMPLSATTHLLSNQDYLHRPIYGKDRYGNPIPAGQQIGGVANEIMQGAGVPVQIRSGIDYATGKSSAEQAIANSLELPIKYQQLATSKKQQTEVASLQSLGHTGAEINQQLNSEKKQAISTGSSSWWDSLFGKKTNEYAPANTGDPLLDAMNNEKKLSDKESKIKEIMSRGLSRQDTEALLKENNLGTYKDAAIIGMKSLTVDNGDRGKYLQSLFKGLQGQQFAIVAKQLAESNVLTTGVVSQWVENGDLTEEQSTLFKDIIKMAKGTYKIPKGRMPAITKLRSSSSIKPLAALKVAPYRGLTHLKVPKLQPRKYQLKAVNL